MSQRVLSGGVGVELIVLLHAVALSTTSSAWSQRPLTDLGSADWGNERKLSTARCPPPPDSDHPSGSLCSYNPTKSPTKPDDAVHNCSSFMYTWKQPLVPPKITTWHGSFFFWNIETVIACCQVEFHPDLRIWCFQLFFQVVSLFSKLDKHRCPSIYEECLVSRYYFLVYSFYFTLVHKLLDTKTKIEF